jgi:hypothetical protein
MASALNAATDPSNLNEKGTSGNGGAFFFVGFLLAVRPSSACRHLLPVLTGRRELWHRLGSISHLPACGEKVPAGG